MQVDLGNERYSCHAPTAMNDIRLRSAAMQFSGASEDSFGTLLGALAAGKPGGRLLELGTGTGLGTAWILDGMTANSTLTSVDIDAAAQTVAATYLGGDPRLELLTGDGLTYVRSQSPASFDLIYADAWVGKFDALEEALDLVKQGGLYVVDDLLPQSNWPENHQERVERFVTDALSAKGWRATLLNWSSGILILVRR